MNFSIANVAPQGFLSKGAVSTGLRARVFCCTKPALLPPLSPSKHLHPYMEGWRNSMASCISSWSWSKGKPLKPHWVAGEGLPIESVLRYGVTDRPPRSEPFRTARKYHSSRPLKSSNNRSHRRGLGQSSRLRPSPSTPKKDFLEGATQNDQAQSKPPQGLTGTLQIHGSRDPPRHGADHRIDIWALGGSSSYEAASGQLPFKGTHRFRELAPSILARFGRRNSPPAVPTGPFGPLFSAVCPRNPPHRLPAGRRRWQAALRKAVQSTADYLLPHRFLPADLRGAPLHHHPSRHSPSRPVKKWRTSSLLLRRHHKKGPFLLRSQSQSHTLGWSLEPYFSWPGPFYALNYDDRAGPPPAVGFHSHFSGALSAPLQRRFSAKNLDPILTKANIKFPAECGAALE